MNYFPCGSGSGLKATYNGMDKKVKGLEIINLASPDAVPNAKFVFNGSLYICGGSGTKNNTGFLKQYNDKEWIDISLPTNYIYNAVVYNDKVHLFGTNGSHYEWDGSTFTQLSNTPTNYIYGSAYIVFDGKIHKLGGYYQSNGIPRYDGNIHYVWDGESWTAAANIPAAMFNARTAVNGNKLYILGYQYHYNSDSSSYVDKRATCYSLNTNGVWSTETDVPHIEDDNDWLGSAETYNGKIYYVCRSAYDSTYGDAISVYTLDNGVWTSETLGYLGRSARENALVDYNNRLRIIGHTNAIRLDGKWMVAQKFPYDNIILPILRE